MSRTEERREVECLYVTLEVQMKIYLYWAFVIMFPFLFNMGVGAIICLYIPLGLPESPAWLSFCFLFLAAVILGVVFWMAYDMVLVARASEEVLRRIKSFNEHWRENGISDLQRLGLLKRAKAMRPIGVPIGEFGEMSLDVPVIMWDEILNQLLFLLSF